MSDFNFNYRLVRFHPSDDVTFLCEVWYDSAGEVSAIDPTTKIILDAPEYREELLAQIAKAFAAPVVDAKMELVWGSRPDDLSDGTDWDKAWSYYDETGIIPNSVAGFEYTPD